MVGCAPCGALANQPREENRLKLAARKTKLSLTTSQTYRYKGKEREIVIEAEPDYATVRLNDTRTRCSVSWRTVFDVAGEIYARQERERRKAARKGKA
jgi:hypothetical protein